MEYLNEGTLFTKANNRAFHFSALSFAKAAITAVPGAVC